MWLFVLIFCFLSLMIYASLFLLRLLPQVIAGMAFLFVTVFVVASIIDTINIVKITVAYCFNIVATRTTYFFSNFRTILELTLERPPWWPGPPRRSRNPHRARCVQSRPCVLLRQGHGAGV